MSEKRKDKEKPTIIHETLISSSDLNRSHTQTRIGQDTLISSSDLQNKSRSKSGKKEK